MSQAVQDLSSLIKQDAEKRCQYTVKEIKNSKQVWILIDESGCVMLNTEDEDCVPVWPHQELAQAWATGEWEMCEAKSISLGQWRSRWTDGLTDDELFVVVFPSLEGEGVILYPDEFEHMLD